MKKAVTYLILVLLVLLGPFSFVYYRYVTNIESPYDDIGIRLNSSVPGFVQDWGCGKLKENFAEQLPPLGCAVDGDPTTWR